MALALEAHRKKIALVVAYLDNKRAKREEKDITNGRFVASVRELIRAEGQDQTEWAERRSRRLGGRTSHPSPRWRMDATPSMRGRKVNLQPTTPGTLLVSTREKTHSGSDYTNHRGSYESASATIHSGNSPVEREQAERPPDTVQIASLIRSRTLKSQGRCHRQHQRREPGNGKPGLDAAQALTRVGRLKSLLSKASDPPHVAAEIARLYLVLSDNKSALKSFRLASKPSPERVPTKQEVAEREVEVRKAMLLAEEKRAEAMLKFEAEDAERNREREIAEQKRRRQAATGIYQCLLALKQPVQAAEAARVRLAMCETKEEIRQVEAEIHEVLLKYDGLVEQEATNQGAWLTESAGTLADLHTSVLKSLSGFHHQKSPSPQGGTAVRGVERNTGRSSSTWNDTISEEGGEPICRSDDFESKGNLRRVGGNFNATDPTGAAGEAAGLGRSDAASGSLAGHQDRRMLYDLGRLLSRKRQFAASRQVFDDAMNGGPDEIFLRERNKFHTPGFFLDMALDNALATNRLDLESRWQGGVEADESRRLALVDFTTFAGLHRGAETLVTAVPAGGWAHGSDDLGYAERFSKTREVPRPLQSREMPRGAGVGATALPLVEQHAFGLLLRHKVPARDVVQP